MYILMRFWFMAYHPPVMTTHEHPCREMLLPCAGQSSSCSGSCGTTVTYTPGGCTGNACMSSTPCTSGSCGSANPSITGSLAPSLSGSLGSLNSLTGSVPGSYYNGGCNNGNCGAVSSIG